MRILRLTIPLLAVFALMACAPGQDGEGEGRAMPPLGYELAAA